MDEKTGRVNFLSPTYQKQTIEKLFAITNSKRKDRHIRVKKATGLGFSELILRLIGWLVTKDDTYQASQIPIVVGPNIELGIKLMNRLRNIFREHLGIEFGGKLHQFYINRCEIQCYPSNHLSSYRSLTSPKFIFLDEADFFGEVKKQDMYEVRYVTERYIAKSKPYIVMVSTPNRPGMLYEMMDREDTDKSIYHLLEYNYEWGLPPNGNVYDPVDIENQRGSFSFEREYNLKYLGVEGNVFSELKIKDCFSQGEALKDRKVNPYSFFPIGIDPGFGSSQTAITMGEWMAEIGKLRVIYSQEFDRPNPEAIADLAFGFYRTYGVNCRFYVDGSNAGFVRELKSRVGEDMEWTKDLINEDQMVILPINFAQLHKDLLSHLHVLVNKNILAIPKRFDRLNTAMHTAIAKEYNLDKEQTSYDDSLDSLRLMTWGIKAKTLE